MSIDLPALLALPADFVPPGGEMFALKVSGDAMIDAMVSDGDVVVFKKVDRARNGEMVAAWLPDEGQTVLKHYFLEADQVRLQPANPHYAAKFYAPDRVQVLGRAMLVVRQLA